MGQVQVQGFVKRYGDSTVVSRTDLDIADGEFLTLLGPSGCGKTTTLRTICGLEEPTEGIIQIGGRVVDNTFTGIHVPSNKRGLGMVFQSYALWPHMTVAQNIAYPLRARKRAKLGIKGQVAQALELVGLADYGNRSITSLSGGQQQRIALARALVDQPSVLLLDEPLSNLDARLRSDLRAELRRVHHEVGTTTVFVTHDQTEALTLSDRIVVMNFGHIVQQGTPSEVFSAPKSRFVADFLGYENIIDGEVLRVEGDHVTVGASAVRGEVFARTATPMSVGDKASLAFRASSVEIERSETATGLTITDISYLGDVSEVTIEAPGGKLVARMRSSLAASLGEGASVTTSVQSGETVAFAPVVEGVEGIDEHLAETKPAESAQARVQQ